MEEAREFRADGAAVTLDDKWTVRNGRLLLTGPQAIVRVLLAQSALDRAQGLHTAGYISGYRGSPLGGVDKALWSAGARLAAADIHFQPGLNEDIAATAMRGTQQVGLLPDPKFDGVFAAWYGKGPGVDRSCDALKHGNYSGTSPHGGVLCFFGDDHAGKSSTVAHQSEQAMASCLIPVLYPADAGEILRYGLLGYAMSRASGAWVGIKCVNETAEQTLTVDLALDGFAPALPPPATEEVHVRLGPYGPLLDEVIAAERRLPRVQEFVRRNGIDRTIFRAPRPRLGIVTAGKSYGDVREALALLGLGTEGAAALGLSLRKLGCIWPVEPRGVAEFAEGHDILLVVEEKKSFIEQQIAAILINHERHPRVVGKHDASGTPLLSGVRPLEPVAIARAIAKLLDELHLSPPLPPPQDEGAPIANAIVPRRNPYFCSGCPHNRSTRIPDGSLSMTGIGCHTMVNFVRPEQALLPTQMGGEGGNWLGIAPFSGTKHIFQNMGDGTYYHSGLLAIRAAVAAGVNITYKILYNDAVAMTGGQPVDGPISVAAIARQVRDEGVQVVVLVSDDPERHEDSKDLPQDVRRFHRDHLDEVQRELRDTPGVSVLIYEQTCAAEKRRRRKRGTYPNPPRRQFIAKSVCEGCGDCSVQSTCVSLQPVETPLGTKRAIDQTTCNKDESCVNGFCPSFITVHDREPRKPAPAGIDPALFADLPEPRIPSCADAPVNLMVAGIGGTGVVTVGALLGMAAHLDGHAASVFDMTGLAQKNGAVYSHVRVARDPDRIAGQRIGHAQAHALLAFDLVASLGEESVATLAPGRTRAVVNTDIVPTVAFQFDRDLHIDPSFLFARLARRVDAATMTQFDASTTSAALLGDTVGGTLMLLGVASQNGLLPVSPAALEAAVRLNGVAVEMNLCAFRLGRLQAYDPDRVAALVAKARPAAASFPTTLEERMAVHRAHLTAYQDRRLAARYDALLARIAAAEERVAPGSRAMTEAAARSYVRLLAIKDEYEVARLLTDPALAAEIAELFGDGARLTFHLAPPILGGKPINGRPPKRAFPAGVMLPLLRALARLRFLRGTPLDPFGWTRERRAERALIREYEALVQRVLEALDPHNHASAIALLGLADEVRGYGPVKAAAIDAYRARIDGMEAAFRATDVRVQSAA